jgi:hypothetical protein
MLFLIIHLKSALRILSRRSFIPKQRKQPHGATMNSKTNTKTSKTKKIKSTQHASPANTATMLKMRYKFLVLIGVLILAGVAIVMRIETPVVWTFLYGIGGWAALTTNPGSKLL